MENPTKEESYELMRKGVIVTNCSNCKHDCVNDYNCLGWEPNVRHCGEVKKTMDECAGHLSEAVRKSGGTVSELAGALVQAASTGCDIPKFPDDAGTRAAEAGRKLREKLGWSSCNASSIRLLVSASLVFSDG